MTYTAPDGETRYVVPAPIHIFEASGTAWYELRLGSDERRIEVVAFGANAAEVGRAEARWVGDLALDAGFSGQHAQVTIGISPASGQRNALLQGRVNGQAFAVTAPTVASGSDFVSGEITLSPAESGLVSTWSGLAHPLSMLALALDAAAAEETGSCSGCVVHATGEALLGAACATGTLAACGALFVTWPGFLKDCTGACA